MFYEKLPLYPGMKPCGPPDGCMRVRLFDGGPASAGCAPAACECGRVTVENPCRPDERAEVVLGVDECGSLVICIHRDPCGRFDPCDRPRLPERCCLPPPRKPPRDCPPSPCCRPPRCAPDPRDRCRIPCRRPPRGCGMAWD